MTEESKLAVWMLTPVELASALMRLLREGSIAEAEAHRAETRIEELLAACHVVVDVEAVKLQARSVLRVHALRAADAMQLGAACEWAAGRPTGRVLHTFDARLGSAARREGFLVIPEP